MVSGQSSSIPMLSATELLEECRKRRLLPVKATVAVLAQVDALDGLVNAYCLVDARRRLRLGGAWARGEPSGLVGGVPAAVKDLRTAQPPVAGPTG